ncbi:HAD-IA family hydrolase [Bacillus sp. CGMCC 1.16541]|uniref:HAD-IA family hydrolase n=1 Tax=Bacillus sp. CGMCC 1.16541 TaxID=2185143 RepID=UPI000D737B14|nr:HAD-IA family hydrolase [Bacillus sp. CGMCC 1.16541]
MKYIIFDFDGTLVDSKDITIDAFNELGDKYKMKSLSREELEELRKVSIVERCKALEFPLYKLPFFVVDFYKVYKQSISKLRVFDGIKEMLSVLKNQGYELVIISSNSEANIHEFLRQNDIRDIDHVFCSSNLFGKDKVIKKFLKSYQLRPHDVMYVGDEHRDLVACRTSGIDMIWVTWGFDTIETLQQEQPAYTVHTPADIVAVVNG